MGRGGFMKSKSIWEIMSMIRFFLLSGLDQNLTTNHPTHYLPDYGDFLKVILLTWIEWFITKIASEKLLCPKSSMHEWKYWSISLWKFKF